MDQGWIDFYVFVGLFLLFFYVLITFQSTAVYKAYLAFHLLVMMWPLSQFAIVAPRDSHIQWMLFMLAFIPLSFLAYGWLIFSLVLTQRLNSLSRGVKVLIVVPPVLSTLVIITNPVHYGPLLFFVLLYSVIYVTLATFLIIRLKRTHTDTIPHQRFSPFILGAIILLFSVIIDIYFNVISIGLLAAVSCFILALKRQQEPVDTVPIADLHENNHDENQVEMILDVTNQQLLLDEMYEKNRVLLEKNQLLLKMQHELSEANRKLEQMSVTDDLTQSFNRRFFYQHLMREIDIEQRYQMDFSILMFDLDNFKNINDTFGHPVGDAILVGITELVRNTLRRSDILARIGGEEFALYLPYTGGQSALRMGERIRDIVERYAFPTPKGEIHITVSIGLVSVEQHLGNVADSKKFLEDLMYLVDKALYEAKEEGRNRIVVAKRVVNE